MNADEFEKIFEAQVDRCRTVLVTKAKEYATDVDRLHNFKAAAAVLGNEPEQALAGFLSKHLVSIFDMIKNPDDHSEDLWDEKLGDAQNYLFLLKALLNERSNAKPMTMTFTTPLSGGGGGGGANSTPDDPTSAYVVSST